MVQPYYKKTSFERVKYLKYLLIFLIIFIPLLLVVFIFSPLAKQKNLEVINIQYDCYVLPPQFTKEHFGQLIGKMKEDNEFKFYFIGGLFTNLISTEFNREFLFLWTDSAHLSADKLRRIIFSLKGEARSQ